MLCASPFEPADPGECERRGRDGEDSREDEGVLRGAETAEAVRIRINDGATSPLSSA